jgi:uncharacterized protein YjbJ (UPF0337 family)
MGEILDKVKGKAEQVAGIVTGDKAQQQQGELDEARGNVKGIINKVEDAAGNVVSTVKQALKKV